MSVKWMYGAGNNKIMTYIINMYPGYILNVNIKIKVVTNKNIFSAIFRFIILNNFQAKIFIKYWEKKRILYGYSW